MHSPSKAAEGSDHVAAQVVGDLQLAEKFQRSVALLRRDIMFAASLYI